MLSAKSMKHPYLNITFNRMMRMPSDARCLSVCHTPVYCVEMAKQHHTFFSLSGKHIILVFPYQYSDGDLATGSGGSSNAGTV